MGLYFGGEDTEQAAQDGSCERSDADCAEGRDRCDDEEKGHGNEEMARREPNSLGDDVTDAEGDGHEQGGRGKEGDGSGY
jgi:hypothetical protein